MRSLDLAGGSDAQIEVRNSRMLDIIKPNIHWEAESHPAATEKQEHCYSVLRSTESMNTKIIIQFILLRLPPAWSHS